MEFQETLKSIDILIKDGKDLRKAETELTLFEKNTTSPRISFEGGCSVDEIKLSEEETSSETKNHSPINATTDLQAVHLESFPV